MIKKVLKGIWDIRWVIITLFMMISFISSTIQNFISKDYDSGFNNLMIVLLFIEVILLLWSRADAEKLIDLQDEIIDSQDTIIKQNEKSIELQDDLIAKQSKWINQVTKITKKSTQKDKNSRESAEQAEVMGYRTDSIIKQPSDKWNQRKQTYERIHQVDAVKMANLAGQGLTSAEIGEKMHRSKDYISKLAKEFDIKIFTKKER
jgi:hypothetical protein